MNLKIASYSTRYLVLDYYNNIYLDLDIYIDIYIDYNIIKHNTETR